MPSRNYSNTAVDTELNGGITNVATSLVVNDATGYPAVPFTIQINDEVILVGAKSGTTFSSLTRGYDNTTGAAHSNNDPVKHVGIAKDFDDRPESTEVLLLAGGTMAGTINMNDNNFDNVGEVRDKYDNVILMGDNAAYDMDISLANGGTGDLWTNSRTTYLQPASGSGAVLYMSGSSTTNDTNSIYFNGGEVGGSDWELEHMSLAGDEALRFKEGNGAVLRFVLDRSSSASGGDIKFYKADGTTISALWDQSDNQWEFSVPIEVNTVDGNVTDLTVQTNADIAIRSTPAAGGGRIGMTVSDTVPTNREKMVIHGYGDILWNDNAANAILQWDESDASLEVYTRFRVYNELSTLRMDIREDTVDDIIFYKADGTTISAQWDESDDRWEFEAVPYVGTEPLGMPAGAIVSYGATTAPTGWLVCDGAAVSRTTYAALFAAISTTYGVGDGSTTFNLPDLVGAFALGYQSGTYNMATTGGAATVALTEAELAAHNHGASGSSSGGSHAHGDTFAVSNGGSHTHQYTRESAGSVASSGSTASVYYTSSTQDTGSVGSAHSHSMSGSVSTSTSHSHSISVSTSNAGSGNAHENMPPYQVVQYIIKT